MYYDSDIESVFATLDTSITGLAASEAEKRLALHGPNELIEEQKPSHIKLFISQFKSFLILILIAASIVSAALGEIADATVIMIIVILSGVLGFIQEYRAEKSIDALKEMAAPTAIVIRDAREIVIPSKDVVPGDIIMLHAGDRIPADSRIVEAFNLMADESALTGESTPVQKNTMKIINKNSSENGNDIPVAERKNMAYMGTSISYGRGKAIVTATGMQTEFGHLAGILGHIVRDRTPLQKSLDQLGRWIGIITIIVVTGVSILGVLSGFEPLDMFIWGIALAVAAIPEALPAVVTVALALGVRRMVKRNSLIRKLPAVETLGATTVICTDKTGTLTQNEMTVKKTYINGRMLDVTGVGYEPEGGFYYSDDNDNGNGNDNGHIQKEFRQLSQGDESHLRKLLLTASLCNDAELIREKDTWDIRGDPTEAALIVAAAKEGIQRSELNGGYPRINEIPFSSERKQMTTIHSTPDGLYAYTKGAPEFILDSCTRILRTGREMEIIEGEKKDILMTVKTMADSALRVMGFAYKPLNDNVLIDSEDAGSGAIEHDMVFVGLVGMMDPPREEAKAAIETCATAGIKTVMITGDHKLTASAVARELDLLKDDGIVLTGSELDQISDGEFETMVEDVSVYARVTPAHKMRVIDAFKKNGHVVAMTGDGVNDAPALKAADMGIAMGITGTGVSKESSDMILTDDNFASIVAAVEEGRNIFKNIRNFVLYGLTCHIGEVLTVLAAMLAWRALPLVAIQILWINLVTDGLPPMALSVERPDRGIMNLPPRKAQEGIITKRVAAYGFGVGALIAIQALILFKWSMDNGDLARAQTMVFAMIVISEMFNAFNWRSERHSLTSIGIFSNRPLIYAIVTTIMLQLMVIYVPFLNGIFKTVPLMLTDWMIIVPLASTTLILVEVAKYIESKMAKAK